MAEELNIPFLGQIPIVQSIREGADAGVPAALQSNLPSGEAFKRVVDLLIQSLNLRNDELPPTEKIRVSRK
jgi:ATP-binding protein involved in chromosome partitioning